MNFKAERLYHPRWYPVGATKLVLLNRFSLVELDGPLELRWADPRVLSSAVTDFFTPSAQRRVGLGQEADHAAL
jgi:hypothetical protein